MYCIIYFTAVKPFNQTKRTFITIILLYYFVIRILQQYSDLLIKRFICIEYDKLLSSVVNLQLLLKLLYEQVNVATYTAPHHATLWLHLRRGEVASHPSTIAEYGMPFFRTQLLWQARKSTQYC